MRTLGWIIIILILVYWIVPLVRKAIGYDLAEGYVGDYVPMSGAGYIPLYQLLQPTPNMPRCIDGDSVRPCWKDDGNEIVIVR